MYLGTRNQTIRTYRDKYTPGIGTLPSVAGVINREVHSYQCEECGKEYSFTDAATEPFFCGCGRLVALTVR